jgi:hypothetical protein
MRLDYNAVLSDADVCGVSSEEFIDWLGLERAKLLEDTLNGEEPHSTISIDMSFPYIVFTDNVKQYTKDIDTKTIFKILIEYIILFRHSSNTEALGEYMSYYLEDETLAYNIVLSSEKVFKELVAYINKYEDNEESLIPYHWDDDLNKLFLLKV